MLDYGASMIVYGRAEDITAHFVFAADPSNKNIFKGDKEMIKVYSMDGDPAVNEDAKLVLFADTKSEVPETGAATEVEDFTDDIPAMTILFTASMEVAVLNTSGTWVWKE